MVLTNNKSMFLMKRYYFYSCPHLNIYNLSPVDTNLTIKLISVVVRIICGRTVTPQIKTNIYDFLPFDLFGNEIVPNPSAEVGRCKE